MLLHRVCWVPRVKGGRRGRVDVKTTRHKDQAAPQCIFNYAIVPPPLFTTGILASFRDTRKALDESLRKNRELLEYVDGMETPRSKLNFIPSLFGR